MFAQLVQAFLRVGEGRFSEHPLTYTPGQIVIGEVVRTLSDREVVVKIHNQTFRAVTEVPLKAQTHHWFQVQSDPDHLVLKVVTDRNTAKPIVPPTVPALLKSWGLTVTRQRVEAANFLIRHDLPLTRQSLEQLATVWLRTRTVGGNRASRFVVPCQAAPAQCAHRFSHPPVYVRSAVVVPVI